MTEMQIQVILSDKSEQTAIEDIITNIVQQSDEFGRTVSKSRHAKNLALESVAVSIILAVAGNLTTEIVKKLIEDALEHHHKRQAVKSLTVAEIYNLDVGADFDDGETDQT